MENEKHHFHRSLGLWDATMLVAGSMIGSGIFIVSADMSRWTGSAGWLIFLWLLSGIITVMAALCYGELAGMMPKAGGQFVYIQRAFGNFTSFLYGWTVFAVIQTGVIAAVAVAFAKYTAVFFPWFSPENILLTIKGVSISGAQLLAILLIFFLTWFNSKGIRNGKIVQTFFTTAKLLALLLLIFIGIAIGMGTDVLSNNFKNAWDAVRTTNVDGVWVREHISGLALMLALGTAIIGSLFSSDAWNNVTFIAGEIKDPKKNIPRSLLLGTGIVTVLYILANVSYLSLLPLIGSPDATDVAGQGIQFAGGGTDRVGSAAAWMIFGEVSEYLMAALIMVSTFGCNNGIILSGARVYYAMAKEGLFFRKASELNKSDVPGFALWVQAVWASGLCLSGTYGDLLNYCTFASLLFYIVTIAGIFVLRRKEPYAERPYKTLGYPLMPIVYILLAGSICLILLYTTPSTTFRGLIIVMAGAPLYLLVKSVRR